MLPHNPVLWQQASDHQALQTADTAQPAPASWQQPEPPLCHTPVHAFQLCSQLYFAFGTKHCKSCPGNSSHSIPAKNVCQSCKIVNCQGCCVAETKCKSFLNFEQAGRCRIWHHSTVTSLCCWLWPASSARAHTTCVFCTPTAFVAFSTKIHLLRKESSNVT